MASASESPVQADASTEPSPQAAIESAPNVTPPAGNPRFPLFDSLRAIAALAVFVGHSMTETNAAHHYSIARYAPELAAQGVAVFFLISGFLLYRPFVAARFSGRSYRVRDYARRRFLRIVPAYWVALTIVAIVFGNGINRATAWRYYGFAQIYSNKYSQWGLGPAWTLCIEVTFYAALPVLAYALARVARPRSVRTDLILLAVLGALSFLLLARVYNNPQYQWVSLTLPATFYWFALGMALAALSVREQWRPDRSALVRTVTKWPTAFWVAGAGIFVVLCTQVKHVGVGTGGPGEFVLYGVVSLCVLLPGVFGDAAPGFARSVLRLRVLSWIGLVSYAFYLYHAYVILWISQRAAEHHISHSYLFVFLLSLPITCLFAAASYYLLERPILRLKNLPLGTALRTTVARLRRVPAPTTPPRRRSGV